jgi:hypothetical protein
VTLDRLGPGGREERRHDVATRQDMRTGMLESLGAPGPHPDFEDQLALYGQFVGDWEFDYTGYDDDGSMGARAVGEWHFAWALDGRAVADVWICPSRSERMKEGAPPGEYGVTVRFYDASIEAWKVTWHGPAFGNVRVFTAKREGDEIVQRGTTPDGKPLQWIYSDVAGDTFHWRSQISDDDGATWRLREEFDVRRVSS